MPSVQLTLAEATTILRPYIGEPELHAIIKALGIKPAGGRKLGRKGRPVRTYDYTTLLQLHAALVPFISNNVK